ncbi:uncharacterized protein LOC114722220 isoform X2 [Neltuma alba]|uniref:uncharacterized protein LOC114722220 isoform X2 n=1 Tax=Neltuma alba TaxID=207710 RepID=UPI0010A4AF7C|nr:uncharacterized protein LOC114722220 isoform X2 [Prosopis alba]
MSTSGELLWLCRLIDESFRSYIERDVVVLICKEQEMEKEVLVALSQVLRKIQLRMQEPVSKEEETVVKTVPNEESLCGLSRRSAAHHCMSNVVTNMTILLTVKSQFVQHLAVKALALITKFLFTMGNCLNEFIQLLCRFWEVAIARSGAENNLDSSDVRFRPYELKRCDWSTVAGINQVLRAVFKYLREDYDDELVKMYYDSVSSCLSKVPWDLLHQFQGCLIDGSKKSFYMDPLNVDNFSAMEPRIKFLGTFLQLLCSLVDQNDFVETGGASVIEHQLLVTVVNLVPRLLEWCLIKRGDSAESCIIQYFKHKLLILMIRLRLYKCLDCSILLSWLELIHNYFQELLWQPLAQFQSDQNECLEGSPFLLSLSDGEVSGTHSRHLQRQAIFLFLDCCFSLISQKGDPADRCICSGLNSCLANKSDSEPNFCCRRKGLLELYKWLQGHLPTEFSLNHERYLEICVTFMSSFIQLYLGEDDLLFEVLLQLLGTTSCLQQQYDKKETAFHDIKKDFPFCLLDVFNPVQLFHLFLSEIHYDHQVLLDYLISKDTGISCAKYLLRCLSLVSNSWQSFVGFTSFGEPLNRSSSKKRRVTKGDDSEVEADVAPFVMECKDDILLPVKNYEQENEYGFNPLYTNPCKPAKECLLSLKDSIGNLHQKKLFPYNPEVLLKRYV